MAKQEMFSHVLAAVINTAHELHEASYQSGATLASASYTKRWEDCAKEAAEAHNIREPEAWAQLVYLICVGLHGDGIAWAEQYAEPQCKCAYKGPGLPMVSTNCGVHTKAYYKCDGAPGSPCSCTDYRPRSEPKRNAAGRREWPRCFCGHIAQDHN